jgi:hypothetical protein
LRDFQPFNVVFLRVTLAALILIGVVYISGQRMPASLKVWGAFFVNVALIIYFKFGKKSSDNQHRVIFIEVWLKIAGICKKF